VAFEDPIGDALQEPGPVEGFVGLEDVVDLCPGSVDEAFLVEADDLGSEPGGSTVTGVGVELGEPLVGGAGQGLLLDVTAAVDGGCDRLGVG
jgi:hypothetical protein